jgi:hypothetical protein
MPTTFKDLLWQLARDAGKNPDATLGTADLSTPLQYMMLQWLKEALDYVWLDHAPYFIKPEITTSGTKTVSSNVVSATAIESSDWVSAWTADPRVSDTATELKTRFNVFGEVYLPESTDSVTYSSITGDASTDVITVPTSAFTNGQLIQFTALTGGSGLSTSTDYFVRDVSGTTFKLAATNGGTAINFTTTITAGTLVTNLVYLFWKKPKPQWTLTESVDAATYNLGDVVYHVASGDCYVCLTQGLLGSNVVATSRGLQRAPDALIQPLRDYARYKWLMSRELEKPAALALAKADRFLEDRLYDIVSNFKRPWVRKDSSLYSNPS